MFLRQNTKKLKKFTFYVTTSPNDVITSKFLLILKALIKTFHMMYNTIWYHMVPSISKFDLGVIKFRPAARPMKVKAERPQHQLAGHPRAGKIRRHDPGPDRWHLRGPGRRTGPGYAGLRQAIACTRDPRTAGTGDPGIIASELPLSWLIFDADQPWPSWVSLRVEICLPQGQILKSKVPHGTISCSTSWWVLSKSTNILTLWRNFVKSIRVLVTIIPNDRGQGQRSKSKLGQVIILTKTLFFE